jgi:Tol biopolymer transport system component
VPNAILAANRFDLSRDGKQLAFLTSEANPATKVVTQKVSVLDLGSGKPARLLAPDPRISGGPLFTPDGKAVAYPILEKGVENVWLQPLDGSPGHQLTHFTTERIAQFAWSPDGKRLAILRSHTNSNIVLLRASQP